MMDKKPDGTIELSLTITNTEVQAAKQSAISTAALTMEIKGFRKGKAPTDVVEQHLDSQKINEKVLDLLLPQKLSQALKTHNLRPIADPHLKVISMKPNQDWQFSVEIAQFPEFSLGDYLPKIKSALDAAKIVTSKDAPQQTDEKKLKQVFDTLLAEIDVIIPHMLIADEVNRTLSRLLQQVQKLGLTIEAYLKSLGKTSESLRQEYETTATDNLKLEFILQKISQDMNIAVDPKEVDAMISAIPDEKTRATYNSASQRSYITSILRKRKTLDTLLSL